MKTCRLLVLFTLAALASSPALAALRKPLSGRHVPAVVSHLRPISLLSASTNLQLAVGLPLRDAAGLDNFLRQLWDPASPGYHKYLTPQEFTARFGPSQQDYQKVMAFVQANGLTVTATHPNRLVLDVAGTVSQIEHAFALSLRVYQHPTENRAFFAPDAEPTVPADVPILDVSGLDNYVLPHPIDLRARPLDETGIKSNATGSGPGGAFIGKDFRAAYAPGVTLNGAGQVIGLFQFGPYFSNNIPLYEQAAGLPTSIVVTNVLLDGFTGIPAPGADDGEQCLDIEMALSMAPGAVIVVYEGNSAYDILNRMATDGFAKQLSSSWGFSPAPSGMDNILLEFAAQGQSMFVASGDGGAYNSSQTIYAPTDDPNITCVGGTSLTTSSPGGSWQSETTWIGSGGGVSATYPIPSWQQSLNMALNHGSTTKRNIPDVAMLADTDIWLVSGNGHGGAIGGTSAASPLWAGFLALVNQQAAANGRSPVGFLNPLIYSLGRSANYSSVFHDITAGNNTNAGSLTNYYAIPGYDLCTGWGSPNGLNFINALAGPSDSLQITPGTGFVAITPYGVPFGATNVILTLTNTSANSLNWGLLNTSIWLNVSASNGTLLAASPAQTVTISLNTTTADSLPVGYYYANVWLTNFTTGVVQTRLFSFIVSSANWPLAVTGFNAGVIVPDNATPASPGATGFDIANNWCFYESGLNTNSTVTAGSGTQGFPQSPTFTSRADNATVFQFGPYGGRNALMLGYTFPSSGTLTLSQPQSYNSLAILAASANASSTTIGTCVVHFSDGSSSPVLNFNAQDWFNTSANVALQGFGRLQLGTNPFATENDGSNPNLYQTILNLAALGLNQPVTSITFTKPGGGGATLDTGVLAISGALMPPQALIAQQPRSVTNTVPSQSAMFTVGAMGTPPLAYQWYFTSNGAPAYATQLPDQTNSSLTLAPVLQSNSVGGYFVVVTNSLDAVTSSVAMLTIFRAPVITQQPSPTNLFLFAGQSMSLSVAANAAMPLSFFWTFNGNPISAATGLAYNLGNLQSANSGNYAVILTNAFGATTSSIVSLTVFPPPSYPYGQAVLADHPISYWKLDETNILIAHDYIGSKNGLYHYVLPGQPGNNLVDAHKVPLFGYLSPNTSLVTNIPIDFSTSGNATFSVEAWVNGSSQNNDNGLITKGTGAGGEQFNLDCGGNDPAHDFRFFVRDASGGAHLATGTVAPNGRWHHLVGVCDEGNGVAVLYVDGVSNASATIKAGSGLLTSSNPMTIGCRQSGSTAYDLQFSGFMEDVAIYNYALSATRVRAHYNAATNRPPVFLATPFSEPDANAGQAYSASIATNAFDPDGDALTFTKISGPSWLTLSGNGILTGTPLSLNDGTNTFVVRVSDSGGLSASATLLITVDPAPVINASFGLQAGNLQLNWSGGISPYQIQMTTNLANPNWQNLGVPVNATNLLLSPSNAAAFYRILGQ